MRRPPTRRCGACTACCGGPVDGSTDSSCCRAGSGRTEGCGGFRCVWLMGFGTPADRPDRLGVLLIPARSESGEIGIIASETRPCGSLEERSQRVIGELGKRLPVLLAEHAVIAPGVGATMLTLLSPPRTERRERARGSLAARTARRRGRRA